MSPKVANACRMRSEILNHTEFTFIFHSIPQVELKFLTNTIMGNRILNPENLRYQLGRNWKSGGNSCTPFEFQDSKEVAFGIPENS